METSAGGTSSTGNEASGVTTGGSQTQTSGSTGQDQSSEVLPAQSTSVGETNPQSTIDATSTQNTVDVPPVVPLPVTFSGDQTTFTTSVPVTLPLDGGSNSDGITVVPSVPITVSNDQTTFTTDLGVTIPTSLPDFTPTTPPDEGPTTVPDQGPTTVPNETPITVPDEVSTTLPNQGQTTPVEGPTTVPDDATSTLPNEGSQVTPTEQSIAVPVTVSNDQTTFTTDVPVELPPTTVAPPATEPVAVSVTVSNDQITFTGAVEVTTPTVLPSGVSELSTTVPLVVSNDQTTFITDVPVVVPSNTELAPATEPTVVPVTISNDQITLVTSVPVEVPTTFPVGDTTIAPSPTAVEEPTTLLPGTAAAASTGGGVPVVPVTPVFSTAITPTVGQGSANTGLPTANTGAAPSGENPSVIILPTTKLPDGSTVPPLVTQQPSITGSLPLPPVSSGSVIIGPSNVITPTTLGSNTVLGTTSGGSLQPSTGVVSLTSGITNPAASGTGTGPSVSTQVGDSTASGQTTGAGTVQTTGEGSIVSSPAGTQATSQGVSQSNIEENGSTVMPLGTATASSNGLPTGSNGVTPTGTPPAVPQFTQTGSPAPISYSATPGAPTAQQPIGSDTLTAVPVPTSLVHAPPAPEPTQTSEFIPVTLPSSVPPLIQPPGGMPSQPEDTTRIQVGFLQALNYAFVVNSEVTQEQIFDFLPPGIAYGLGIPVENVTMETLKADDTSTDLPYIRTLALAFIPKDQVNNLYLDLHTPAHPIYHNPNASIAQLMSFVDPSVAIQADNPMTPSGPGSSGSAQPTPSNPVTGGAPIGDAIGNDMPVRKSSVAIGVGVVCGAAAYGAAMFFIARRYKMRRQSHGRSPSMFSSPVYSGSHHDFMGGANHALMSGAMRDGGRSTSPMDGYGYGRNSRGSGRSGSTGRQQISAPVMAENSLGWN